MMIARLVFFLLFALSSVLPASALEIYRNGVRYDIIARLPGGADYIVDGVDRKFPLPGVSSLDFLGEAGGGASWLDATRDAVASFQGQYGLTASGVVDQTTAALLANLIQSGAGGC